MLKDCKHLIYIPWEGEFCIVNCPANEIPRGEKIETCEGCERYEKETFYKE